MNEDDARCAAADAWHATQIGIFLALHVTDALAYYELYFSLHERERRNWEQWLAAEIAQDFPEET